MLFVREEGKAGDFRIRSDELHNPMFGLSRERRIPGMKWIFKVEEYGLGFILLFISLFMCLQVILRYVFASSVFWAEELMRYLMVLMIFFGASLGIEKGTHIGMDALAKGVSERNRALIESISFFLVTVLAVLLTYYSVSLTAGVRKFGQKTPTLLIPAYLVYGIFPVSFATMAIRSGIRTLTHLKSFMEKR